MWVVGVIGVEGRVESAVTIVQPSIKYPDYVHEPVGRGQEHGSGGLAQRQYSTVTGNVHLSCECLLGGSDTSGPESLPSVQSLPSVPLGGAAKPSDGGLDPRFSCWKYRNSGPAGAMKQTATCPNRPSVEVRICFEID